MKHTIPNRRLLFVVLLCVVNAASVRAANLPSAAELESLGLELRWESQAVLNVYRDRVTFSSNDEQNVYVQSTGGVLTVFHAENGTKRWVAQVGNAGEPASPAISNKDTVVVVAGPVAYGFNKFDGSPLFEFRFPHQPSANAAIGQRSLYVPLSDGSLYAYPLSVLEYRYRYGKLPDTVAKPHVWRFICNEEILFPPVIGDRAIAFVTQTGSLHSVATSGVSRGRSRFQLILEEPASAPLAIVPNDTSSSIVMLTADNQIFSVDLLRGITEWTYPMGRAMTQVPQVVGNEVIVLTEAGLATKLSRDPLAADWGRPIEVARYVSPMFIGAAMLDAEIDEQIQDSLRLPSAVMPQIQTIIPGGAAHASGILPWDRIISINGVDVGAVKDAHEQLSVFPLRVERTIEVLRVAIGTTMGDANPLASPVEIASDVFAKVGIPLLDVTPDSASAKSGLRSDDIVIAVNDTPITTRDAARKQITMAAPGKVEIKAIRGNQFVKAVVDLQPVVDADGAPQPGSPIIIQKLGTKIPVRAWESKGLQHVTALGRFGLYGIDVTNRLVAFDRETGELIERVPVTDYRISHRNVVTDQIYVTSTAGEIACLREIGAKVKVPELSPATRSAKVASIKVKAGDGVVPGETVLCELELADGSTQSIKGPSKGIVKSVSIAMGDTVYVGDTIALIAEDAFATYHQRPGDRPIAVEAHEGNDQVDDSQK